MHSIFQPNTPILVSAAPLSILRAEGSVRAGFPSPAEDFAVSRLDIGALLVKHPQATYLLRVAGPSMREFGIDDGDLVAVDRALQARHGCIVVAVIEGEFTVKKLFKAAGMVKLKAGNPTYPDITPKEGQSLEIWGVVTSCIKIFA
ncbi:LexA family transcriptional regulator [Comamonas sp. B-9]|uniref:LexA family protein n=1 Tax=Comamonas sp. B-9 TaxID=1055192 RepID=UPI000395E21C|nr:translesion error-prone DNA polymerase V autoproteolytic subunit [Comamonas sp. B-9]